jgi:CBS-domain-containing membrane protein
MSQTCPTRWYCAKIRAIHRQYAARRGYGRRRRDLRCKRVDSRNTTTKSIDVETHPATAEANTHLRARTQDWDIIDRAAELVGANRSQFMLASALGSVPIATTRGFLIQAL